MVIYILLISLVTTICALSDAKLHSIDTQDLQSIVDSIKRDVDLHLKKTSVEHLQKPSKHYAVEDIDKMVKNIKDSMHERLIQSLGQPSDAKNGGSPMAETLSGASVPGLSQEQLTSKTEGVSEFSSHEIRVGSAKGMPGVHFPDYTDIPRTSFVCADKPNLPGFYADLDTGCQAFHVCWPDRRESFLCPMGTIFNQAFKVCDYWYNSNCSLAPYYYTVNGEMESDSSKVKNESIRSMINTLLEKSGLGSALKPDTLIKDRHRTPSVSSLISKFMPIKAKIVVYPETANRRSKIVTSASIGENKALSKSKSRLRNLGSSKHSRERKSVDEYEKIVELVRDILYPFTIMDKSYTEVLQFRISEALDSALVDIDSNKTLSILSGHVEKLVRFIKYLFLKQDLPESLDLEPGSELYEYDIRLQEALLDYKIRSWKKEFLYLFASVLYNFDQTDPDLRKETASEFEENAFSLTHLDPRFIVQPATEEYKSLKDTASRNLKVRVKRSATNLHPLKYKLKGLVNISSGTKKALIKNYIKFFKTKRA